MRALSAVAVGLSMVIVYPLALLSLVLVLLMSREARAKWFSDKRHGFD